MYNINYFNEVTQTPERKAIAELSGLNKIRIGNDPRKCTFRLILPSVNIAKIVYKLINEICGHYTKKDNLKNQKSSDSGKIGEVKTGTKNSLKSKVIIKNNTIEIYIWNGWDDSIATNISKDIEHYKNKIQEFKSKPNLNRTEKYNLKSAQKELQYANNIYNDFKKAKEFFFSEIKKYSVSNPITLDLNEAIASEELNINDKKFNTKKCEEFWNGVFDFICICVGYSRGQWLVKDFQYRYFDNESKEYKYFGVPSFTINKEFGKNTVGDRGRYFHFSGPYAKGIRAVVAFIEKKYKVKIKDVHWTE